VNYIIRTKVWNSFAAILKDRDNSLLFDEMYVSFLDIRSGKVKYLLKMINHVDFSILANHLPEASGNITRTSADVNSFSTGFQIIPKLFESGGMN